jgi:hypothetical protein
MVQSALVGQPPVTEEDYWIATYMMHTMGNFKGNASLGFKTSPARPHPIYFETRRPGIIVGLSICIVFMAVVTGLRLYLRFFTPRLKAGLDDMLIIPGAVSGFLFEHERM